MVSSCYGHADVVLRLLGMNANIHLKDKNGNTVLMMVAMQGPVEGGQ